MREGADTPSVRCEARGRRERISAWIVGGKRGKQDRVLTSTFVRFHPSHPPCISFFPVSLNHSPLPTASSTTSLLCATCTSATATFSPHVAISSYDTLALNCSPGSSTRSDGGKTA